MLEPWPVSEAAIDDVRFVLTHLAKPQDMLARAHGKCWHLMAC